jgi:NAD(P)-dependent dehydrogenase (short-subunit alcohol dehydrogenase family)
MSAAYLQELFGLTGKTAVVVGGSGVLCGRMAEALACAGAHVLIAGRDEEKLRQRVQKIESIGGRACFCLADVSENGWVERLHESAIERLGAVDVLVNGAGVNSAAPYFEIAKEDWSRVLDVNLTALHETCQRFAKEMASRRCGSIINIASVSAGVPLSKVFAYAASKAAVVNYTQNLARELGPFGVRVNALSPGFFPAEQNRKILDAERTAKIMGRTPLGRFGEPSELDGAVLLLASDKAGSFLTGANLVVDGGFLATSI